ncbi:MAG: adenylosuccinate synthase [Deinococcus sp.]|nr:adenylosuccinate synthase [Deinococcus sp.]
MPSLGIIGAQWGDEGKGKITDYLAEEAEVVVRFQGGANAGHTVVIGQRTMKLHLLPCGVLRGVTSVLGEGMVIDLDALEQELAEVQNAGFHPLSTLRISNRAHLVLPHHKLLDAGGGKLGTTGRGIGPAYTDRAARIGLRAGDLLHESTLQERLATLRDAYPKHFQEIGWRDSLPDACRRWAEQFAALITDTGALVRQAYCAGQRILFEGGQGTLLDLSAGTYPFVTSSYTSAAGIAVGAGIPPQMVGPVYGVAKAYTTRVGQGPFPTELTNQVGERLRQVGREYGATTGRPRRCGWLDGVALRYACELNSFAGLIITKLDVLSGLPILHVATGYRLDRHRLDTFPTDAQVLGQVTVEYETLPGWEEDLSHSHSPQDFPPAARQYLDRLAQVAGVPLAAVSTGAERRQIIPLQSFW